MRQLRRSGVPDLGPAEGRSATADVLERIRRHPFAEIRGGRTIDPQTGQEGVADLGDDAWRVRQLAIRDLVRLGDAAAVELAAHLRDEDPHVRQVAAAGVGILKAEAAGDALEARLEEDPDPIVRSQAALSLGQMGLAHVAERLTGRLAREPDRDVLHRMSLLSHRPVAESPPPSLRTRMPAWTNGCSARSRSAAPRWISS